MSKSIKASKNAENKKTKGGFFETMNMAKIYNTQGLINNVETSITTDTSSMFETAKPVFSGISSNLENNLTGLIGSSTTEFLPTYGGSVKKVVAKAKAVPAKAKAVPAKAKADPSKAKAAPSKAKPAPSKAKPAPSKAKAAPSKAKTVPSKAKA